jgi:predicted RNA-binding protein with PIN domain
MRLKSSRGALVQFIEKYRPQGSRKNKVSIVFDGREDIPSYKENTQIEIIFTKRESADDRIKKIVQRSKNPKQIVVVTDDRQIRFFVHQSGAKVMAVNDFLSIKNKIESAEIKKEDKHIPIDVEISITDELRKIWLSDNEKKYE